MHTAVRILQFTTYKPGADTGFPIGEGTNIWRGPPTYDFAKLSKKLHEIEKILGRWGEGRVPGVPSLNLPL